MTSQDKSQDKSVCLWHNMQTDNYFIVNNGSGVMTRVNRNTDYVKEFDPMLTGQVGHSKRVQYALEKGKLSIMPLKAKSIKPLKSEMFYTPQTDKLESYAQFPHPRTLPYYNQKKEYAHNPKKLLQIKNQSVLFSPESAYNKSLFQLKGIQESNAGVSHLSDSMKNHEEMTKSSLVKVLMGGNLTEYNNNQSLPQLGRKVINGRTLPPPNNNNIVKTRVKTNSVPEISLEEYTTYPAIDPQQAMIERFVRGRQAETCDFDHFTKASKLFNTQTFDGTSFNSPFQSVYQKLKGYTLFEKALAIQKQELDAFQLPIETSKSCVVTKGRFKIINRTTKMIYERDREIMMLLYPELYTEKIDPQKQKQDELRKKINLMKEKEILERNLKNKV